MEAYEEQIKLDETHKLLTSQEAFGENGDDEEPKNFFLRRGRCVIETFGGYDECIAFTALYMAKIGAEAEINTTGCW